MKKSGRGVKSNPVNKRSAFQGHLIALEPRMMFDGAGVATASTIAVSNDGSIFDIGLLPQFVDAGPNDNPLHTLADFGPAPALVNDRNTLQPTDNLDIAIGDMLTHFDSGYFQNLEIYQDIDVVGGGAVIDTAASSSNDFIFIDTNVTGYQTLASEWTGRGTIVLIDGNRDGIEQMNAALAGASNIGAIHIVSHGADGMFWLGTTRITADAVNGDLRSSFAAIGSALSPDGDLLIYGCDTGAGDAGQSLLDSLARTTGADVAASIDDTGSVLRGGDWTLERHLGTIDNASLVARDWDGLLAPATLSAPANSLTVRDASNNNVVFSGGATAGLGAGTVARWTGVGTVNGQTVDLVARVVSVTGTDTVRFLQPNTNNVGVDDFGFQILASGTTGTASAQITWTVVLTGTNTAVPADVSFTIADIDGVGGNTLTRESVVVNTDTLSSYQSAATTDIRFISAAGTITASGTQDETANPPVAISAARFNWLSTSGFVVNYNLNRAGATAATFSHDGDSDISLGTGGVTVSIPRLDLDGNDSTTGGSGYLNTFTENGAGVSIVDSDLTITNPLGTVQSSTVTLTNAQTGDELLVNGSTAASGTVGGIAYTRTAAGVVTFTTPGTAAQYAAALQAVTFRNTTDTPGTTDRVITVGFANTALNSNLATSTIRVVEVNDTPTISAPASYSTSEDTPITIGGITLADVDAGNGSVQLTVSVPAGVGVLNWTTTPFISVGQAGTNTIIITGQRAAIQSAITSGALTLTPAANFNGSSTISFVFNDRGNTGRDPGLTADSTSEEARTTATLTITAVNDAPVPVGTLPPLTNLDGATGISVATASGFSDVDNATLTYSAAGLPAGLSINTSTGVITGTIDRSASQVGGGVYNVVVTARDAGNLSATQSFSWTVTNPPPVAVNDTALVVNEDTAGTTVNVLANDSDPDGDPITVTSASATRGTVVVNANGTITYTPNANFNGTDTITYTISDGQGGTATATIPVTVNPVNDAPVAVGTLPPQTNLDSAAGINVPTAGGFTDVDNATLTYSATGLPAGLSINTTTGAITGTIDRSASQVGGGNYTVVVTATDAGNLTATQTFNWRVTNPGPVAANDSASTTEDTAVTVSVLANDNDPDGDPLTVTAASAPNGTVVINANGTITYTPNANFNGTDTITYTISDGQGGSATATVAVTIAAVNDAPVPVGALPPRSNLDAATGISVPTAGGFSDVDNATLTYSATGLPAGLSINSATGVITGTIDRSASQGGTGGIYSVVVTARDAGGLTATQTFGWTVTNPPPVAVNDTATTNEDTPVLIPVLPNDSDPDGDPLTLVAAVASVGQATIVGNQVNYVPPANFNGTATITYTISDGQGGTARATITVTVNPVNDAPVGTPLPAQTTTDGAVISVPVAANFSDVDGDTLAFSATGLPPGLTINPVTGVISGTIDRSASQTNGGTYTATITVSDGRGGTTTQPITFNVSNPPPVAANDSASTSEDTPVTISPLANDRDPDGDPLTITSASALNGTVVINANGTVTYTPNPGYNGTDRITYTISDGNGGTSTATITVAVADVNDVPVRSGTIANQTNLDAQVISLPVAGAFTDPDGDPLSYTATGLPAGLTINPTTGVISGTIDRSASQTAGGVYAITVTASDGRGGSVSQTFTWTVTNPAPSATNDTAVTNEDTAVRIPVLANDTDPDGDPLSVTAASAGNGTVAINPDGSIVYTPNPNFNGTDTIIYRITDSEGGVSTASVNITVRPVNDAPTTVGLPNQNGDDGASVSFSVASAFGDPDGDRLTFSATGLPPGLTLDPATGLVTGVLDPSTSQGGPYVVTVTATDPSGAQVTTSFVYSVQNIPPVAVNDVATTPEDVPVRVAVLTNDSDPDRDPLTITSASANNGTVVINADGTLTFTPDPNFNGIATIAYTITDGNGGLATATLTVTVSPVNDAPVATVIPNQVSLDSAFYSAGVAPFFSDIDGDTLTYSVTGLPAGLSINPVTGIVSGTIDRNASQVNGGIYNITVTASDGRGGTVSTSFTGTVTNPAPTATNDVATTNEDTPVAIPVLSNDTDPDGDPLIVTGATAPNGTVSISPTGVLTYTPNANFNGTDTITYVISDGNGGTSTATVRVTVNPVNDPPVAVNDNAATNEDTPVTIGVLGNDTDIEGDTLTVTSATSPNGTVLINPNGTITFTPAANFNGPTTITYTISDGNGGTSTATVAVTVNAVNDAPVANPSTATTPEDTPVNVPVLANDTDVDGNPLTVTAASAPNGTVTINPDGTVTYTPNRNFNGSDTITYTISDGQGGFSTSTVTVTVSPVNDAPVVATAIASQRNNDANAVNLPVAGNFSDVDGNPLTFTATGLPPGLSISPAGVISGTIDRAASQTNGGVYTVSVTANDGNGGTVTSTFTWTVANPGPTATNDAATTNEDTAVIVPVLANDNDPDGDPLTVTNATAPNGTVVINGNGTVTYTPNPNFNGTDTITYTISDGNGGTSTATVTVTVASVNDAPVVDTPIPAQNNPDSATVSVPVAGNFSDLDRDTLSFSATGLPAGLSINPATGVISGTIDRAASQVNNGVYSVSVTASDGRGGSVTTTFAWTVTNPPPVATNDTASTSEDTPVTVTVLANDRDPDGDPLTITSATAPNGTVVINANGSVTYTPNANFNGSDTITYTISDGNGGTSTATVAVTIAPVNDAPVVDAPLPNLSNPDSDTVSIPVAGNFSDLDANTLSFTATGLPAGLSISAAGVISGTIDRAASQTNGGLYTVSITASDGNGGTVTTSFTWTINNPGPVAVNDVAATSEETPVTVVVLTNDSDPDGDPLTVTSATAPNGTVVINANGTVTYTPNLNFNGTDTITYTVSDGNGGTSTATVTVTVAPVNDAPVNTDPLPNRANVDSQSGVSVDVSDSFADVDGNPLSYSATGLPPGLSISAAGIITGTITNSASQGGPANNGVYTVTVTASDGNSGTVTSTFIWTVTNPAPTAVNDAVTIAEDPASPAIINVLSNDTDPDGDPLTVTSASANNGTVTINPDGTLNYTPRPNFNGTDRITYTISDGNGGTSTATVIVTVTPVNDAPVTLGLPDLFDSNGEQITAVAVAPAFSDVDNATLTYSATGLTALGLSIDPVTGVISGTIPATASSALPGGAYPITITATDGGGLSVSTAFTWTITNEPPRAINDNYTGFEDTLLVLDVLTNDIDPDGNPATPIQIISATANNGTAVVNPDGTISFTPDPDFNGTATVTYTIQDANGAFATAVATIVISPVNDAPVGQPIPDRQGLDGNVVTVPFAGFFSDRDSASLTYSAANLPLGLSINPVTGEITGTIAAGASQQNGGVYTAQITASDGTLSATQSFTWTIGNPGPTAANDTATTAEDVASTPIAVLSNDVDPDGDTLTVTSATAANGTVTINANGTLTYTPDADFNGTDTITYAITDSQGGTSTATVTVTVTPANDAPTATPLPARSNADSDVISLPVAGSFTDRDGDPLQYSATGLPTGLTIDQNTGVISGTINRAASQPNGGIYSVTVTAIDGNGGTVSTTFSWTVTNPPPVAVDDGPIAATEDTPIAIPVLVNDTDPDGDPLTVTQASAGNGTVSIGAGGVLTYTPNANFNGPDTITYQISDGNGGFATASVTINVAAVNDAPVASPIAPRANVDGATVSVPVAANFSDVDGNTLTYSAAGLPLGLNIDPNTGTISGIIDRNASQPNGGVYSVTVTASDGNGGTVSQTFSWTVTNPPPVAVNDFASTPEDFPVNIAVLGNDSDPDGDALRVTTASAGNGTVVIRADGTIDYTPGPDFNGTDTISYTISDGNGGTASATVTVTVGAVNDPPVAVNDATSTDEDTPVTVSVLANDSDIDGNPLTVVSASAPNGTVAINPDGTVTYTPNSNFNGTDTITYQISDGQGGFATATVTVIVRPVNDAPVARNDTATTPEDTPVTIAVLGNDSDVDGNPLTVTSATSPDGQVTINPDGSILFTPNANFNGSTTISYTISDGRGGTSTASVTLTVSPVNDAPVANPSVASTNEDTAVTLSVLANDTDVDGDPLTVTAVSAANGTVAINPDGTVTYTPNANFNGTDTVTYTISDGRGGTSTSTVTVTVNAVNDLPVASNDNATTPEDQAVVIPVLGNDRDVDGDPLTITNATSPSGTVAINPDGTITFTPNPNFNGPAVITYTISDGRGGTATATVNVTVTPVNDPPVARPDTAATNEDTPLRISPLTNDTDVEGNPLTIISATSPNGTIVINPDGTITYTPDANFNGTDIITYQISDGQGGLSTATITVSVAPINDPPVARNDVVNIDEDTPVRIPVLANDTDVDGDPLTVTAASAPNGTVVINPDGTITYTPRQDYFGTDTITYTISDGRGGTSTATVTVNIRNTNELPVDGDEAVFAVGGAERIIDVLGNATDPDRDPLSVFTAKVDIGTVTINPDGTLSYIAPADFQGVATITYIISDGRGGFNQSIVTVTVTQATADINALLGEKAPGIPDGWLVDRIRDQSNEYVTLPLIIDDMANGFRSLNNTPDLGGNRPLLTAVNGISWLRGVGELDVDGSPVGEVVNYIDRIRDLRFGADRLFDPRFGDFILKSLTGFSVRQLSTGNDQVMIESVVRDRVIYMEIRDIGKDSDPRMFEYQLRSRDGKPLPDWIHMDARGLAIIERPADAETIHLIVRAIRADGQVIEIPVLVQGATGEIQLDEKIGAAKISGAAPLKETMALAQASVADETAQLLAAFKA
jgi:large repetitive protein